MGLGSLNKIPVPALMIRRAVLEEPKASRRLERGAQSDHRAPEQFTAARVSFTSHLSETRCCIANGFKQEARPKGVKLKVR